jgi:DNA-binding MarR family transcriptional regulator
VSSQHEMSIRQSRSQNRSPLDALYDRPGFMIRRAHQIAASLFSEEVGELGVTTTQYGVLWVLRSRPNLDQIGLAKLMGLDRSTTGLVVGKLAADGLILRRGDAVDRRRKVLVLTEEGRAMLSRLEHPARRAQDKVLSALTAQERKQFLGLLGKIIETFNNAVRTPIFPEDRLAKVSGPLRRAQAKRK